MTKNQSRHIDTIFSRPEVACNVISVRNANIIEGYLVMNFVVDNFRYTRMGERTGPCRPCPHPFRHQKEYKMELAKGSAKLSIGVSLLFITLVHLERKVDNRICDLHVIFYTMVTITIGSLLQCDYNSIKAINCKVDNDWKRSIKASDKQNFGLRFDEHRSRRP